MGNDVYDILILLYNREILSYPTFMLLPVYMPVCRLDVGLRTGILNGEFLGFNMLLVQLVFPSFVSTECVFRLQP